VILIPVFATSKVIESLVGLLPGIIGPLNQGLSSTAGLIGCTVATGEYISTRGKLMIQLSELQKLIIIGCTLKYAPYKFK